MSQYIIREMEASLNASRSLLRVVNDIQRTKLVSEQLVKSLQERQKLASLINSQIEAHKQASDSLEFTKKVCEQALASRQFAESFLEYRLRTVKWIREFIEDVPEREEKGLQVIAEEGWFFDPEMPFSFLLKMEVLVKEDAKESSSQLNDYFIGHFGEQLDNIEKKLAISYPHREHLLLEAFSAHHRGEYSLSIRAFLSEADGIFGEIFRGKSLFIREQREYAIDEYASGTQSPFLGKYYRLFLLKLPLWASESEREESFSGLNRHQVLHGESLDYDTEENSLKTISLLCFLRYLNLHR